MFKEAGYTGHSFTSYLIESNEYSFVIMEYRSFFVII